MPDLTLNGEPRSVPAGTTLRDLVPVADGVAVAVDGEVVPRGRLATHTLADGQRVEIVTAVQGG
ncbi:sulfur carrier protein ThiS [Nocardioides acrostichi]|uniref:Sulfur carrier protein ThiS n=1 Tax=Nocardioides acrostichi TaxID=2784339 RepID=A0A930V2Q5_9ACTN|nr:sulfur carrier protein ThiS [Nocardioides acrostichi]MBF4163585.1 sulfur carrier protein ThiS [Nocardioides acrostichi]